MDNAMYESLAEEIYKITTAPYIVSLKVSIMCAAILIRVEEGYMLQ